MNKNEWTKWQKLEKNLVDFKSPALTDKTAKIRGDGTRIAEFFMIE